MSLKKFNYIFFIFFSALHFNLKADSITQNTDTSDYVTYYKILNETSNKYYLEEDYINALKYKIKELQLHQKNQNDTLISKAYERLAMIYYRVGNYKLSTDYFVKALSFFEQMNDSAMTAQICSNLANVYTRIKNYNKALKYQFLSLDILPKASKQNKKYIAGLYINIGLAYEGLDKLDSALYFYNNALTLINQFNSPDSIYMGSVYNNIGEVFYKQKKYKEAEESYQTAYNYFLGINNENGIGTTLANLAKIKIELKDYNEAINLCEKALTHFKKINSLYFIVDAYELLSKAYKGKGDFENAYKYLSLYIQYHDSLSGNEIVEKIANLELNYNLQKEQQKIKILEQQKKIIETENEIKQTRLYVTYGGIFVLILIIFLIAFNYRTTVQKNKLKETMLAQKQEQLKSEVEFKQKELENFANYIQEKNKLLESLNKEIQSLSKTGKYENDALNNLSKLVSNSLHVDNYRKELELKIDQNHQEFIHRLKEKFPNLTKTEIRLCSLLLLGLSTKDIASVMSIEPNSVKTARNRLRKKLSLQPGANLEEFLTSL